MDNNDNNNIISEGSAPQSQIFANRKNIRSNLKAALFNNHGNGALFQQANNEDEIKKLKFTIFKKYDSETEIPKQEEEEGIHYIRGNFNDLFNEGRVLGEGSVGLVKKAYRKSDNAEFAVKISRFKDEETVYNIKKEFANIVKLDHENIVKVYELYIDVERNKIYTIMELVKASEMFEVIKKHGSYSERIASKIFKQILLAIQYMHSKGVCHRDLKPNNILCEEGQNNIKITDFNVSKFNGKKKSKFNFGFEKEKIKMWTYTGTIAFSAPEIFLGNEYDESVDMWSAGVVLYTMLSGYQPFNADYVEDLIKLIVNNDYQFHENPWNQISANAKDLIQRCLCKNPKERITPTDALMHPWIAQIQVNPNILPNIVTSNLRNSIRRLTKNPLLRSKQRTMTESFDSVEEKDILLESPKSRKLMKKIEEQTDETEKNKEADKHGLRAVSFCENPGWNFNLMEKEKDEREFGNINECIVAAIHENDKECREFLEELEDEKV